MSGARGHDRCWATVTPFWPVTTITIRTSTSLSTDFNDNFALESLGWFQVTEKYLAGAFTWDFRGKVLSGYQISLYERSIHLAAFAILSCWEFAESLSKTSAGFSQYVAKHTLARALLVVKKVSPILVQESEMEQNRDWGRIVSKDCPHTKRLYGCPWQ